MTGQAITHYRVQEKLGQGGMGVVYKAEDLNLHRTVALKFLPEGDEEQRRRFLHEAQAAASLSHPNICTIYEIDREHWFLAMEYIEGVTLKEQISGRPLKLDDALAIALQVGAGLQAAHEKGIVHRDIKPANVMLTAQGVAKITDFGLARLADRTRLTKTGMAVGTPAYMSPEQVNGSGTDQRADIWSLGVLLYEMIAGRPPFAGASDQAVTYNILHGEFEPLTAVRAGVPLELDRILAKALARNPADRYQHVADLLVDLRRLPQIRPGPTRAKPGWTPWAAAFAGMAVTLIILYAIPSLRERLFPPTPLLPENARIRQLTTYSGTERSGALAPDGKFFAFVSEMERQPDIYVRQVSGGTPVRLTKNEQPEDHLIYSDDGQWIYYAAGGGIWRIGALGGAARKIVEQGDYPAPSPDGKRIAYVRANRAVEIAAIDGSSSSAIVKRQNLKDLAWSPDGRRLAFTQAGLMSNMEAWAVDIDGNNLRKLTAYGGGGIHGLAWHPDSRHVIISRSGNRDAIAKGWDLWLVPYEGGKEHRLSLGLKEGYLSSVSARGRSVLISSLDQEKEVVEVPLSGSPEENGRAAKQRLGPPADPMWIHLPHRREALLVNSLATGIRNLWIHPLNSGEPARQVTTFTESFTSHATLSPDLSKVAYLSTESGNGEVWTANVDGSHPRRLTHDDEPDFWPVWSPDGKWIMFGSLRTEITRLWKVSSEGGTPVPITRNQAYRGDWSPRGDHIAYWCERGVEVSDVDTGDVVARFDARGVLTYPFFSPDGARVAYSHEDETIWIGDVRTGKTRLAVRFPEKRRIMFRPCWTSDGKSLIVNRSRSVSNIALLDYLE